MKDNDILNEEELEQTEEELEQTEEELEQTEEELEEPQEELEVIDLDEEEREIIRNIEKEEKSKKRKIFALIALLLVGSVGITHFIAWILKRENKKPTDKEPVEITTQLETEKEISIDDIGETVDLTDFTVAPEEIYSNPTGEVEPDKIVEKDGELFVDQEAADNKDKVGETSIDDKNGRLEVTPEGTVVDKEEEAQIKTPEGTVVTEKIDPNTKLPEGYVRDETLDKDVKEEDANKYVKVGQDYYRISDGTRVYSKDEYVLKEALEKIKNDKSLTTVKPIIETTAPETTKTPETTTLETIEPETESNVDSLGGVLNPNGTYTIYGVTYMDKATFQAFIMDENPNINFGLYKGVIYPAEVIQEMFNESQKSR